MSEHISFHPSILYFGTPAVIISSLNEDGTTNISPMSSAWALGYTVCLGLANTGKTIENLRQRGECVLNYPDDSLWAEVEALGRMTGRDPVPASRIERGIRYVHDKFGHSSFTPIDSELVQPDGVAECPLRMEAKVLRIDPLGNEEIGSIVQVQVTRVSADPSLVDDESHIVPERWKPLIYNFRHYFGLGERLGIAGHAETR